MVFAITQSNYLNIGSIIINEVFGNIWLFILAGIIIIAYIAMENNLPSKTTIMIITVFVGVTMSLVYLPIIWIGLISLIAVISYTAYKRSQSAR